jgi:hypothetical protein
MNAQKDLHMADSGIFWIDYTFNMAVRWLNAWADFFGITYEEINVWIFVIGWPLQTAVMLGVIIWLIRRLKLERRVNDSDFAEN